MEQIQPTPVRADLIGLRILVVENDATSCAILLRQLTALGAVCDLALDGMAGLAELRTAHARGAPYHLALVDMKMPRVNGIEFMRAVLESAGCLVTTAVDGRAALDEWRAQPFALVLMDCQMPELDGFEANRAIRAQEIAGGPRVPIVALTANTLAGVRESCLAAGMDDYLPKPFKRNDLVAVLQRWVDLAPRPVAAARDERGSSMSTPADFDPAAFQNALLTSTGVDSPLARKLIRLFVGESAKQVAAIERAAAAADTGALLRTAHSLKSSAASVGASVLSAIAKELEALARAGQTGAFGNLAARLRPAHARFCEDPAIRDLLAREPIERNAA